VVVIQHLYINNIRMLWSTKAAPVAWQQTPHLMLGLSKTVVTSLGNSTLWHSDRVNRHHSADASVGCWDQSNLPCSATLAVVTDQIRCRSSHWLIELAVALRLQWCSCDCQNPLLFGNTLIDCDWPNSPSLGSPFIRYSDWSNPLSFGNTWYAGTEQNSLLGNTSVWNWTNQTCLAWTHLSCRDWTIYNPLLNPLLWLNDCCVCCHVSWLCMLTCY